MKYKYKTTPYVHQVKALHKLLKNKWGGALLMEPRTGKTKVAIDYASIMHTLGHVNRVFVFAPVGVMGVWEEEIPIHCPVPHRVILWDKDARKETPLPAFGKDILDFVICNYDAAATPASWRRTRRRGVPVDPKTGLKPIAWFTQVDGKNVEISAEEAKKLGTLAFRLRSKGRGGRYEFKNKVMAWQPQLMILDESHRIKSPAAAKSRFFHQIADQIPYRVIMTGTVVTKRKRIWDVYSQWLFLNKRRFVDEAKMPLTFAEFKDRYSVMVNDRGFPQWKRNKNEGHLHKLMHKDAFSVLREDCYDLPALTTQVIPVHLEESARAYDQMAEDMVARIAAGEITEATIVLTQGLRLRQISNGIAKTSPTEQHPEGRVVVIGSEKLDVLEDRLTDLMEAGEHVIIGAAFRPDIQRIAKLCEKHKWKHFVVQGGVKVPDRQRIRKEFEAHEDGAIFIGQPAAASEGIDLRSAAITIWYSLPTSWVHYQQFCDRNALHPGPRFMEYLLVDGVDRVTYENTIEDGDVAKMMITSPKRLLRKQE